MLYNLVGPLVKLYQLKSLFSNAMKENLSSNFLRSYITILG